MGEPRTIWELVGERAREHGPKPYLHFGDETWSYERFRDEVARLAGGLRRAGIGHGDGVHVYMNNSPWTIALDLALASLGAVAGPINCLWGADEIAYLLSDSGARAVVVEGCYRPNLEAALERSSSKPRLIELDGPEWRDLLSGPPLVRDGATGADRCCLFYTSGTTGRPKGVPLTHANLLASVKGIRAVLHSDDERFDEVGLIFLPLFHVNAMMSLVSALNSGVTVVLRPSFSVSEFAELVERHRVSFFSGVPTIYRILLEVADTLRGRDLSSLRFGVCGAAPLSADLLRRFEERFGFPIIEGYGLTEGTVASTLNPLHGERRSGSIGQAIPGQEVAILDDAGRRLAPREIGEICIRGPNVMAGYLGREDANREAFQGGWFRTGDVGYADEDAYFYIVDRKKDMYIRGGENVYPKEVEQVIAGHPAVAESAVIGVPDEVQGEVGRAFVVLRDGATLSAEALADWLSGKLADYKVPARYEFIDRLPKNIIGKVLKKELRKYGPGAP